MLWLAVLDHQLGELIVEKPGSACYSAAEVAEKLGLNIKTVYEGIKSGEIPSITVCRRKLIPKAPIDRKLEGTA